MAPPTVRLANATKSMPNSCAPRWTIAALLFPCRGFPGSRDWSTSSSASPNSGGAILRNRSRMLNAVERNTSREVEGEAAFKQAAGSVVGPLLGNSVGKL